MRNDPPDDAIKHRFFFALRPPADAIARIDDIAPAPEGHDGAVARERLHLTTFMLGDFPHPPEALLERAAAVADALAQLPFRVAFDRLVSGNGRALLAPSEPVLGLERFRTNLRDALHRADIRPPRWWRYGAHMTLLYGDRPGVDHQIETIGWLAEDFVLIHSLLGRTRHEVLDCWRFI